MRLMPLYGCDILLMLLVIFPVVSPVHPREFKSLGAHGVTTVQTVEPSEATMAVTLGFYRFNLTFSFD